MIRANVFVHGSHGLEEGCSHTKIKNKFTEYTFPVIQFSYQSIKLWHQSLWHLFQVRSLYYAHAIT